MRYIVYILSALIITITLGVVVIMTYPKQDVSVVVSVPLSVQEEKESLPPTPQHISVFQKDTFFSEEESTRTLLNPFKELQEGLIVKSESSIAPTGIDTSTFGKTEISEVDPLKDYGNAVARIITQDQSASTFELNALNNALLAPSSETGTALIGVSKKYTDFFIALKAVAVPGVFNSLNFALAEAYRIHGDVLALSGIEARAGAISGDTLLSLSNAVIGSGNALINLSLSFRDNNVVFDSTEPGFIFMQITPRQ